MKEAGKARYIASPKNPDEGILIIADVEYKDAGFIRYSNARGDAEVELVVYGIVLIPFLFNTFAFL